MNQSEGPIPVSAAQAKDKTHQHASVSVSALRRRVRWMARRLELRAISLAPEQFSAQEGVRAALAVGIPLLIAKLSGHAGLGWAVFAAFWTCLCDGTGPDRLRRQTLGLFVLFGAAIAFIGSWGASGGVLAGLVAGPILVFLAVMAGAALSVDGLLGTLLAVVCVVAIGYPKAPGETAIQALAFLGGGSWAFLLITLFWRIDPTAPLERNAVAVIARLSDMAADLLAVGDGDHRDAHWHSEHGEHRRAVRVAMERLSSSMNRYAEDSLAHRGVLEALEAIFGSLVALDHAYIQRLGPPAERAATARAFPIALSAVRQVVRGHYGDGARLRRNRDRLVRIRQRMTDDLMIGCLRALENALSGLKSPKAPEKPTLKPTKRPFPAWRERMGAALGLAMRQSAGVGSVYYTAVIFHLRYPYWATMALVVVLQKGARITWARGLERMLGSLLGGLLALALLRLTSDPILLFFVATGLATASVALRSVNYSLFVIFLTMLFITVTELLHPGNGIASARVIDNLIGSLAALVAALVLWPDLGPRLRTRLATAKDANLAYLEAVNDGRPKAEVDAARRAAGLASNDAEMALHDLGGLRRYGLPDTDRSALSDLRNLAGQAAAAWHRRLAYLDAG